MKSRDKKEDKERRRISMLSGEETQGTAASRAPRGQLTLQASSRVFRPCLPAANVLRPLRRRCSPERRIAPVPPLSPPPPMSRRDIVPRRTPALALERSHSDATMFARD
ncbi:hypothetical protein HBI25_074500 [Parastagonospora nodorum]|nr:hypothetical protein HBH51_083320 [Parastagonospora nodorum]KAH4054864.1 hypothetical protein HBH49_068290 [Parastagonospora nodorum]KAH4108815.1 hypothetical protein HBH46_036790 [Parastagonospora nodorum]KAH4194894.1 hypothetical protein HBH42_086290 [Parastagonospora nodorum]KAH4308197.1 hypothetical protein HBI01_044370 [Parastagonospora nodorum]